MWVCARPNSPLLVWARPNLPMLSVRPYAYAGGAKANLPVAVLVRELANLPRLVRARFDKT